MESWRGRIDGGAQNSAGAKRRTRFKRQALMRVCCIVGEVIVEMTVSVKARAEATEGKV